MNDELWKWLDSVINRWKGGGGSRVEVLVLVMYDLSDPVL